MAREGGPRRGAAAALAAVALVAGCSSGPTSSNALTQIPPAERPQAPHLTGTALDGSAIDSAAWAGDVVVVNFWGSWCGPCVSEAPTLAYLARSTKALGVHFLGIDVRDSRASARAFERAHHVPYPSLFDEGGNLQVMFRKVPPSVIPSTIVIDREGRIAVRFIGEVYLTSLRREIRRIAAESG